MREFIAEKEIETVVRKSHVEQFEWMANRFAVKLHEGLSIWPLFVEITERRNLLVHSNGIVSSHYLSVCQKHSTGRDGIEVGMELTVDGAYIVKAYECVVEIAVKLAHVLWRKIVPEERKDADEALNQLCLDMMIEGRFALAQRLLDFATTVPKKWSTEVNRLLLVINRAQAYKWLNNEGTCRKILDHTDWTAVDDRLSLGVAVLKDDFETAVALMKKIGTSSTVGKDGYRQWPIFRSFRKSSDFKKAYNDIFGEDFAEVPEEQQYIIHFRLDFKRSAAEEPNAGSISEDLTCGRAMWPLFMPATTGAYAKPSRRAPTHFRVQYNRPCGVVCYNPAHADGASFRPLSFLFLQSRAERASTHSRRPRRPVGQILARPRPIGKQLWISRPRTSRDTINCDR